LEFERTPENRNKSKHTRNVLNTNSKQRVSSHNQDSPRRLSRNAPCKDSVRNKSQRRKFAEFSAKSVDEHIDENAAKSTEMQGGYQAEYPPDYSGELPKNSAPQAPQFSAEQPKSYEPIAGINQEEKPSVLSHESSLNVLSARQSQARFDTAITAEEAVSNSGKHRVDYSANVNNTQIVNNAANPVNTVVNSETKSDTGSTNEAKSSSVSAVSKPDIKSDSAPPANNRRLQFSKDEIAPDKSDTADKKITKLKAKAERSGVKLETARGKLPVKKRIKRRLVYDEQKGKAKKKLVFEEQVKSQREHIKGVPFTRPVKALGNIAALHIHNKVYQAEHENVALKAAHRAEMLAEGGVRMAYHRHKTAPYRKVQKLEKKTARLNFKASYKQALNDIPKDKKGLNKAIQKRRIKRNYAKENRKANSNAKVPSKSVVKAREAVGTAISSIAKNPKIMLILLVAFLVIIVIMSVFAPFASIGSSFSSFLAVTSYLAEDEDIDNAELSYTEWETDLRLEIDGIETVNPLFDEYRYNIGEIGHDPHELMAFLTAVYEDFSFAEIEADLREIFDEQYNLTLTPSIEIRYRTVTVTDPETGESYQVTESYEWHILTIVLDSKPLTEILAARMDEEQKEHYDILMISLGFRQYTGSPFDFDWLPLVSSYYGYRVHPITGQKDYHKGIDIAVPAGTNVYATHDGIVSVGYDDGGYGYYITIIGAKSLVTKYAHLESTVATDGQEIKSGDLIAKSGNSGGSTGAHLHFEVIKDGQYLNPIYFAQTDGVMGVVPNDPDLWE